MKTTQKRRIWGYVFRLCCSKGISHIIWVWQRPTGRQRGGKTLQEERGNPKYVLIVSLERSRADYQEAGHFCDWFGEHICLSLVGPELEARRKLRNARGYWPSPDFWEANCCRSVAYLPALVVTQVVGHGSLALSLAIAQLYCQFLTGWKLTWSPTASSWTQNSSLSCGSEWILNAKEHVSSKIEHCW